MGKSRHIGGLDIVRFWAALVVSLYHMGFWCWGFPDGLSARAAGPLPAMPSLAWLGSFGWAGVEVFFVISGFVICYSAENATPGAFARSRILRLVPGVWICAPVTAIAVIASEALPLHDAVSQTLRSMGLTFYAPWIDSVYWTLGIEICFYAGVWTLLVFNRFAWLEPIMVLVGLASTAFWAVFMLRVDPGAYQSRLLDLILVHHGQLFAIGVLLSRCVFDRVTARRVMLIAIFCVGACMQLAARADVQSIKTGFPFDAWPSILMWAVSMVAIVAALVWPLRWSWLRPLGLMTYPLYLIHNVASAALIGVIVRAGVPMLGAMAIALAASIFASWIVAMRLEPLLVAAMRPALAWMAPAKVARAG